MHAELTRDTLLIALRSHIGRANGVTASGLVREILGVTSPGDERNLRELVVDLRMSGHHVCATTRDGYYLAETPEELEETVAFLRSRSMSGLQQIAAMKRVSVPDLIGQMHLPT